MVKTGYFLLALLLLTGLIIVCGCTGSYQSAETTKTESLANSLTESKLRIVTEEFPPFNYAGSDGKLTGQATDVVKEILARQNQKAEIEILPWSEGYELALSGPSVALYSTGRTEERESLFKWAGPVASFDYTFYAKNKTDLIINSLEAAKKEKSVGAVKDDARYQFLLENNFTNIKIFDSDSDCINSLITGDITLWFGSTANAGAIAKNEGIDPLTIIPAYKVRTVNLYIAFSSDTPDSVVQNWQETLDAMKQDGTFNAICQNYGFSVASSVTAPKSADIVADQALNTMVSETDSMFRAVLRTYEVLAATEDVKSGNWQNIRPLLAVLEKNEPDVMTWYALADGSYYTVADNLTSANLKNREYFPGVIAGKESAGTVVVSRSTGKNAGIVAVPVIINNSVAGILGASLYLDTLTDTLRDKIPEPFIFYAIDSEEKFAIHSDKGRISQNISAIDADTSSGKAIETIFTQKSGTIEYEEGGIHYKACFISSPLTGWHFIVAWPKDN